MNHTTENEPEIKIESETENGDGNEDNNGGDGSVRPNNPTEQAERTTRPRSPSEQSGADIFFLASNRRGSVPVQLPTGTPRIETARRNRRTATATATTTTTNLSLQLYYYYYWRQCDATPQLLTEPWRRTDANQGSGGVVR